MEGEGGIFRQAIWSCALRRSRRVRRWRALVLQLHPGVPGTKSGDEFAEPGGGGAVHLVTVDKSMV